MTGNAVTSRRRWNRIDTRAVESLCDWISIEAISALQEERASDGPEEKPLEELIDGPSVESEVVMTSEGALFNVVLFSPREEASQNGGERYDPSD